MKILLNVLTHGNELVGVKVVDKIQQKYQGLIGESVDISRAHSEAYRLGKRYIDMDLNRAFPGNVDGNYEQRLAYDLSSKIPSYDIVIDVHSTESGSGDMVIVTKIDEVTLSLLKFIAPKYVLYMNMKPDTSLISMAKIGIALEMGSDADEDTFLKSVQGIESVFSYAGLIADQINFAQQTQYLEVFESVSKPQDARLAESVKNFNLIKKGEVYAVTASGENIISDKDFYPVIFGNANYETIFGFAARKLDL